MRSILRSLALVTMITSGQAFAFFPVNPLVQVRPEVVSAQVYNPYYEPIACQGFAFGRTVYGQVFQAYFNDIIPPGQNRFAVVHTNAFANPFANGWADIRCRFLRW